MLRTRRRQVLATLAALVLLGLAAWWVVASRPARPAAPRVVLPIRTDTGWGVIDAATGTVIVKPVYPEPLSITPYIAAGWDDGVLGGGLSAYGNSEGMLEEAIERPVSFDPVFFRLTQPQVRVVVARDDRRGLLPRGSWPFVAYGPKPRAWAYTVAGDVIAKGTQIRATRELLAIADKTDRRLLRVADLQPVPPGSWSEIGNLSIFGCNLGEQSEHDIRRLLAVYDLDGQPAFGPEVTHMWMDLYATDPEHVAVIAGQPPSITPEPDFQRNARRKFGVPMHYIDASAYSEDDDDDDDYYTEEDDAPNAETTTPGILLLFEQESIQDASVYWQTPEGLQAVPGPPFDLAWRDESGRIRALRGNAVYELQQDQEPRQIGDLAEPTAWTEFPPEAVDDLGFFYRLAATPLQPERLITHAAGYVRQADGSFRRIGPANAPEESYAGCYFSPNRVHLLLDQDPDDRSAKPLYHLDTYDLDGALVSRTLLQAYCFARPDFIETFDSTANPHMLTTDILMMYADAPLDLPFDVLARLSDPESPTLRLLARRDGDLYVADAHGARIHDLPDDLRRLASTLNYVGHGAFDPKLPRESESSWAAETPTETWLLDRDGRCIARLPHTLPPHEVPYPAEGILIVREDDAPVAAIGNIVLEKSDAGMRVFDTQLRDFTGRTWSQVVLINDDILALIAADELRYIRLADASTLWSWQGAFFNPPSTSGGGMVERFIDRITPATPATPSVSGEGDDDDDDDR